jgi:glycosyltransferase involved in cell wall biosynthesis
VNVGFYFHIPMVVQGGSVRVPAHLGRVVHEIAAQAGTVTFYGHSTDDTTGADFVLAEPLVRAVDLGPRRSFPARTFRPGVAMRRFRPQADGIDVMLVRGPSPLMPYFAKAAGRIPVAYYLQADYMTGPAPRWMPAWRRAATRAWKIFYTAQQRRTLKDAFVIVNSRALGRSVGRRPRVVHEVISSVVERTDVVDAPVPTATGTLGRLRMVFAGRLVEEKGLLECVEAVRRIVAEGIDAEITLCGAPDDDAFARTLDEAIARAGVRDRVHLPGFVPLEELGALFRERDVFVLASYHEGFPHVLLDAMAAGLPVIATKVGGLPDVLVDGDHAVLIESHSVDALTDAMRRIATDDALRARVAAGGLRWAAENTLEKTCGRLVELLRELAATNTTSTVR